MCFVYWFGLCSFYGHLLHSFCRNLLFWEFLIIWHWFCNMLRSLVCFCFLLFWFWIKIGVVRMLLLLFCKLVLILWKCIAILLSTGITGNKNRKSKDKVKSKCYHNIQKILISKILSYLCGLHGWSTINTHENRLALFHTFLKNA